MFTLSDLEKIIAQRAAAGDRTSYTASLLSDGMARCARKFGEEAVETVIAAMEGDKAGLTNEAADMLYHLLVLLHAADIPLGAVMDELQSRTAMSGIEEKAARNASASGQPGQDF
jgi:phosphoribosyl-ATP pyrophosphohydrolase